MGFRDCPQIPTHETRLVRSELCCHVIISAVTNLSHSVLDDFLVCDVALVSNEELIDTFSGITVDLLQPLLNVIERV